MHCVEEAPFTTPNRPSAPFVDRRRCRIVAVAAVTVMLVACGDATASDDAGPTNPVSDSAVADSGSDDGVTVVALDDFATLAALAVGVTPDLSLDAFEYESTRAIIAELGIPTQPYGTEVNIEQLAALRPDVMIGVSLPTTSAVENELGAIAPTTIIDYTATWDEQVRMVGDALDRSAEAEAVVTRLETDVAALGDELSGTDNAGAVASVLAFNESLFSVPADSALGSVMASVGLTRPAAQSASTAATSPFVDVSPETLEAHDADLIFALSGGAYDASALEASPLWSSLGAVERGSVYEVSGELWLSSSAFGIDWILRDLHAVLVDGEAAATAADVLERYEAFSTG